MRNVLNAFSSVLEFFPVLVSFWDMVNFVFNSGTVNWRFRNANQRYPKTSWLGGLNPKASQPGAEPPVGNVGGQAPTKKRGLGGQSPPKKILNFSTRSTISQNIKITKTENIFLFVSAHWASSRRNFIFLVGDTHGSSGVSPVNYNKQQNFFSIPNLSGKLNYNPNFF